MTAELVALVLAALWQNVQIVLAGRLSGQQAPKGWLEGPRDEPVVFTGRAGRALRAVDNHFEGLAFFTIAVLVTVVSGQTSALTAAMAWVYLVARVLYVPAYLFGWTPWRSVVWGLGWLATMVMLIAALV